MMLSAVHAPIRLTVCG